MNIVTTFKQTLNRTSGKAAAWCLVLLLMSTYCAANSRDEQQDFTQAIQQYKVHCESCHAGDLPEAPRKEAFKLYPPERIVAALETGVMSVQGMPLSTIEKQQMAHYLTGKPMAKNTAEEQLLWCDMPPSQRNQVTQKVGEVLWNGWGNTTNNARHQANFADAVGTIPQLEWAFAFPDATRMRSQPIVTQHHIYIGSQAGTVFSLSPDTGCVQWTFQADAEVRGALYLTDATSDLAASLVFGDLKAHAYSIDARTGKLNWKTKVNDHPMASITGSVIADLHQVYVPVSSLEIIPAAGEQYECCSFRGTLLALDLKTGKPNWLFHTTDKPKATYKSSVGTQQFGPSGAPIWSSPTLDLARNLVYVGTGQNYSSPATLTSDAVLAVDRRSGKLRWSTQVTANDAWNGACVRRRPNCPEEDGPDFDIGASVILATSESGKQLLIAGQKSGKVYALDPDDEGKMVWQQRVGSGGTMGGVHWGMSADNKKVYVGVSDLPTKNPYAEGEPKPGLHALDLLTGEFVWRSILPNTCPQKSKFLCYPGISAAVTSSSHSVFAGGLDGMLRQFNSHSGEIIWEFNTRRSIDNINPVAGFGGAIEADGPVLVGDRVYVTSGYDKWGEAPGNLLLMFKMNQSTSSNQKMNKE